MSALAYAAGFLGFCFTALATVSTICLVKINKNDKVYEQINNKLTGIRDAAGTGVSNLADVIKENDQKNEKNQKKQNAQIDSINKEAQLKKDIRALQAQIEQAQKDLGTAKTQKTKLEKAINTLNEMKIELDAALAADNTQDNIAARLDRNLWTPLINAAGALLYNNAAAGGVAAGMDNILDACADVNGRRDGNNLGAAVRLKQVIELLADRQADAGTAAGAANLANGAERMVTRNFLTGTFRPELQQQITNIKKFKKAIAKNTADLKAKKDELAALQKKNK